jgi:two-component system sensor histidine kinase YesM
MKFLKYIKVQIAAYYLVASLLLVGILGVTLYLSISNIVLGDALKSTTMAVDRSGNYLEVYIDRLKTVTAMIVKNPSTIDYMTNNQTNSRDGLVSLMNTALDTDPFLTSIVIVSKDGRVVSNEASLDMTMSEDMMNEPWYVAAIHSDGMPVLTSARMQKFSMDKEHWVISISQEITDANGNNIGVMLCDIKYQVVEDYLAGLDLGANGFAYIINDSQEVVYHGDTHYFEDMALKQSLLDMLAMGDGYHRGMNKLNHQYHLSNADWTLVGVASLDGLDVIKRQMVETLVVVSLILLITVIGSGFFIAGRITNPIRELEKMMANFDEHLNKKAIDISGSYEIESLTRHFNVMVERVGELMGQVLENEKYLRTYEINALHSQINPHFLYNTLDTIVWMAEFDDSDKVIEITKSLAQFFRLSLSKGDERITVENEIDHAKQYLFIQQQRYQEKLTYSFKVDEQTLKFKVPKIILQPIVENALYHGIREMDGPGHIEVKVWMDKQVLYMEVTDNGVGFELKGEIFEGNLPVSTKTKLGGVGLSNVNKRIHLYDGEGYGVSIRSVIGEGTKVLLKLAANP